MLAFEMRSLVFKDSQLSLVALLSLHSNSILLGE